MSCKNNQDSQLHKVYEYLADNAPNFREGCSVEEHVTPCKAHGVNRSTVDTESQLFGISSAPSVGPSDFTRNLPPSLQQESVVNSSTFLSKMNTRERRADTDGNELNRFHPLATGNPQDVVATVGRTSVDRAGEFSRNDAKDNFFCPQYKKY